MTDQELIQKCDNLERRIKQLESAMGKTEADSEPEFERVKYGEKYYRIEMGSEVHAYPLNDIDRYDQICFDNNNYFHTEERAQEVADKIKFLLKLERFHDIYCSDYKPDWNSTERKYLVYFDHSKGKYSWDSFSYSEYAGAIYFPTREIAQKVCNALNKELE